MKMDRSQTSEGAVVAIELVAGSSKAEEWSGGVPQTGDVVEEIRIGAGQATRAPFKGGRAGVQKLLHSAFRRGDTSIRVKARRAAGDSAELHACIVPRDPPAGGRRQYVLRSIHDPNYAVGFVDRSVSECIALQRSMSSRVVCALSNAQLQDGYVAYPWDKKMRESLEIPNSSGFLSVLILPKASDSSGLHYNSLEDTLARANAWLNSSQASGVPILFINIQTEALLTKISGETASCTVNAGSLSDLSNLGNVSLYGFEDYHGVDIGVVRAVRLWYTPLGGEVAIEIKLQETDTKLGFAISRTEEGFIYISSVIDDEDDKEVASTRSGLKDLYKAAMRASKLLVISRVSNEKVLPWMVSSSGAIRCFDTVSLSQKLSLHRHALRPILLHVFLWEKTPLTMPPPSPPPPLTKTPAAEQAPRNVLVYDNDDRSGAILHRDTAGDVSFRFHDFSLPNNWV
ncbi:uncharacterized protein LOC120261749 [Dioscorea cayenensis subsp. rotundata]|uniref:Uncharacterized protein LOC120261749 n=1 Tax=Dioscorea cayennensis subsp. rotundata TaxID=55577 RepID=A0AB40BEB7_DIOCR|nr:uncharacterized protein LOC120261749 [Dioscorea cayenensis subsp. rotundata]